MENYKVEIKVTMRVKQHDVSEHKWEKEFTIPDVASWTKEHWTVAEDFKFLIGDVIRMHPRYKDDASQVQIMVENGSINGYVRIKDVFYQLSNAMFQGSKVNLIKHYIRAFPHNKKLDIFINFTYQQ